MHEKKSKISKITLFFIVVLTGLIIVGMMGAEDEDTSWNGLVVQQSPFSLTGGTPPLFTNKQASSYAQQKRIPNEGVWMSMEIEGISSETIREMGLLKNQTGVIVDSVPPGSIAEKAGLRNGDIIKAINGQIIVNMADYIKATKNQRINSAIIEIVRDGRILCFAIPPGVTTLAELTGSRPWVNATSYQSGQVDSYTRASAKITRIFNKGVPPISMNSPLPHAYMGVCAKCHEVVQGRIPRNLLNIPANSQVGALYQSNYSLPSPAQQKAAQKVLVEGHWLGMELIPITPELAQEYKLPAGVTGLLVDEVTLEAAESGLLAGDVLQSINNIPIKTLGDFAQETRRIESLPAVTLGVVRNGKPTAIMLRSSWGKLGVAQNEAAQPIQPGAISPHKNWGRACTDCHIIMKNGGQLQTDAGDILPVPPPIIKNVMAPHSYRGQCNTCHAIMQ